MESVALLVSEFIPSNDYRGCSRLFPFGTACKTLAEVVIPRIRWQEVNYQIEEETQDQIRREEGEQAQEERVQEEYRAFNNRIALQTYLVGKLKGRAAQALLELE